MRFIMKNSKVLAGILAAGTVMMLAGCGSKMSSASYAVASDSAASVNGAAYSYEEAKEEYSGGTYATDSGADWSDTGTSDTQVADTSRKLIKTVNLNVETKEFDTMLVTVQNRVKELGGYVENMDVYNGSTYSSYRSNRDASLTARIPQDRLDDFLNTVSDIGNVTYRSDSVEDITLTYVDTQSHKDALETEQERLIVLLDRAESIEDIITIESRLSEVRYQLESIESKLRTYDNQVDYSTVYLSIGEVQELTPVEEKSAWQRMGDGFIKSIKNIATDIKEFLVWFVIHIPYIVILVIIIVCIIFILKAIKRRTRRIKEQTQQNTEVN
jgi:hypothetical protein